MAYDTDPPRRWRRKNYDESVFAGMSVRQRSEIEADRDLAKPPEQLVCDVHEETHANRAALENIAGAQKRLVSLMARVAKSNDRIARYILWLTFAIAIMTAVIMFITLCH
jgi:hypothetical protein